jgi:two-component system cell cycle sensor histidine kinase PleC
LAKARGGKAAPRSTQGVGPAFRVRPPQRRRTTSIAILAALILLALFTGLAAMRLRESPGLSATALFAPVAIAAILALLLLLQGRQADAAARAFADSEERFRLAVEAARCGIWEWDLRADEIFMSEMTGVMLGWGGGGVATGDQVLERIAPEHRERVRQALAAAAVHGAFDVSFRAAGPDGKTVWIDARGQALDDASADG